MEYRTKEEQVADFLREGIISGQFARGSRLKQEEIARRLKTSITPVREALRLLVAQGYVESDSYRGMRVVALNPGTSVEILKLRITLESQLVESAVRKINAADIVELRRLAAEFEEAAVKDDSTAARGVNYRLHRRIVRFCRASPDAAVCPGSLGPLSVRRHQPHRRPCDTCCRGARRVATQFR